MYDNDTFQVDGMTFRVTFPYDDSGEAPWEREDGHGPVSEWRRAGYNGFANKEPGERPISTDGRSARFYDFAGACRIALRDGWLSTEDANAFTPYMQAYRSLALSRDGRIGGETLWEWIAGACIADDKPDLAKLATHPKMRAARAAESDFDRLRRWCNDQWSYVGVVVELLDDEGESTGDEESVWGIESDSSEYLDETARELAGEIIHRLKSAAA